jgi:hypothetical protein
MKSKIILCLALILSGNSNAAIVYPKAPDGGRQLVYENAGQILRHDPRFFGGLQIDDLTIANPCRNYFVGATNLASGQLLSAAKTINWQYLLVHGTNAVGAACLIIDETNGKALKFNGLNRPFFPDAPLDALRTAEQLPQVKKQDYELRILEASAVYFRAVWLHGESDDIIIPLPETFRRWNAYQPYSESQMIKLLKPEAKKVLKAPRNFY